MPTLISAIVTDAYRENNLIPIGTEPSSAEMGEGLLLLSQLIESFYGYALGEYLMNWNVPPSRTAPVNARYPLNPLDTQLPDRVWPYPPKNVRMATRITTPTTVYLPYEVCDGALIGVADVGSTAPLTIDANGKRIEGADSITLDLTATPTARWMFRQDTGSWARLTSLTMESESPLPPEFDSMLVTGLAIRLAPRHGRPLHDTTAALFAEGQRRMRARYAQDVPVWGGFDPRLLSEQSYNRSEWGDDFSLYRGTP